MKKLTRWEAACIVAGNGIGGGVMAVPFLLQRTGIIWGCCIVLIAYLVSAALHLMLADMLLTSQTRPDGGGLGILSVFREFLFRGRFRRTLTITLFALLTVVLTANLAVYIAGAAEIIDSLTGASLSMSRLAFWVIALIVPSLGLRALGVSEKWSVAAMITVVALLTALSVLHPVRLLSLAGGSAADWLGLYGLVMFCLSALFAVPQAADGLEYDRKALRSAVLAGLGINALTTIAVSLGAILASDAVTKVAIIGWSATLGKPVEFFASVFVLLAMFTSFWAISLALRDMVHEQTGIGSLPAFVAVTLPSLLLTYIGGTDFITFAGICGGAVAVIVALLLIPAYRRSRKAAAKPPLIGRWGDSLFAVVIIALFYILMAIGSLIA